MAAGTVDMGAIDDLRAVSALCREEKLWFHVDGAYGALGMLSPETREYVPKIIAMILIDRNRGRYGFKG